jgi:lipid A 3-O-deacylase
MSTLRQLARLRLVNSVRWRHCAVCFSLTSFWGHSGQAQANSAAGIVLSPATFSILNPSVFGENSAVAIGGAYGNRPEKKTYLFSASLSHVRFQFGRTYPSHPIGQTKELTTGLDYAAAIAHVDVSPTLKFMSGFQASAGYGVINDMYGAGFEGMSAGILLPVAARISGPGVRLAPFFAPGFFLTREVIVGLGCASNTCHFSSNGLRVSLGGGVRLDLMGRLSIEAGVRKTQTANAISRQSIGASYRIGNLDGHGLRDAGSFTLEMDNDLFARTSKLLDEDYTQGFHFTFNRREGVRFVEKAVRKLHQCDAALDCLTSVSTVAGQEVYTPQYYPAVTADDRPYGGWLYGGVRSAAYDERKLTAMSIKLGVTGKPSLAEQLQVTFHELEPENLIPAGWDDQIKFEPGIALTAERKNLHQLEAGRATLGLITAASTTVGNILTDVEAGATVRAGFNADHPWVLNSSRGFGVQASFGIRQDLVLRNLFLDGNTFRSGPRVHRTPLVWQKEIGFGIKAGTLLLEYRKTVRSREFSTGRRYHPYGTISLTRRGLF